ncbi:hypothetical protein G6F59_014315 [Rhizopus arrhizus]|nr:hypothetical protein G6F59_014315 [Rhizopus arrhizus]
MAWLPRWIVPLQVAGRVVYDVNDVTDYCKQPCSRSMYEQVTRLIVCQPDEDCDCRPQGPAIACAYNAVSPPLPVKTS